VRHQKEWGRTDAVTAPREAPEWQASAAGLTALFLTATVHTVYDDAATDSLFGEAGLDWFFAKKTAEPRQGERPDTGEVVTTSRKAGP